MAYNKLYDGDGLEFSGRRTIHHLKCCDCGLVHRIELTISRRKKKTKVRIRFWRDERATAQGRRRKREAKQRQRQRP